MTMCFASWNGTAQKAQSRNGHLSGVDGVQQGMSKVKIRLGDSISIGGPWYEVVSVRDEIAILRTVDGEEFSLPLTELERRCGSMSDGVVAYIGYPTKWLPVAVGLVYYGADKGYLPPIIGGYVEDDKGQWVPNPDHEGYMARLEAKRSANTDSQS
jgi:hypothetical protein